MILLIGLTIVAGAMIIYYCCFQGLNHFKTAGIIHKRPMPLLGNIGNCILRKKPLTSVLDEVYKMNSDAKYVGFYEMMLPVVVIRDPELLKIISTRHFDHFRNHCGVINPQNDPLFGANLMSQCDDEWRKQRLLLNPIFSTSKMKAAFELITESTLDFCKYLCEQPAGKSEIDMQDACVKYSHDLMVSCGFGVSVDSMRNPNNKFWQAAQQMTKFNVIRSLLFMMMREHPKVTGYMGIHLLPSAVRTFMKDAIQTSILARKNSNKYRPDMIQALIEFTRKETDKSLSMDEIVGQIFLFHFAALSTLGPFLPFLPYELAMNPTVYQKLQEEVDSVDKSCGGNLTYDALKEMPYLEAVINEALRLYPVATAFDRVCTKDYELPPALPGGEPFILRKGDVIWFPAFSIQRDAKHYEDPTSFKPERFISEDRKLVNDPAYFPFGRGPRICIAYQFALLASKLFLYHLVRTCQVKKCAATPDPLVMSGISFGVSVEGGIWLDVRARERAEKLEYVSSNGVRANTE